MRAITRNASAAFAAARPFKSGNTEVTTDADATRLYLHGNLIAERTPDQTRVTLAGWPTRTTRDRLNGLLYTLGIGANFYSHQNRSMFGDRVSLDGEWHTV